jgi:O-antigen/teichoic acid export membrane protein
MSVDKSDLSALLSSSSLIFVGMILTSVATLLERVIIARAFDVSVYGDVSIGLAIVSITTGLSIAGLNHGVPRFISRFDDEASIRGVWLTGFTVSIGLSVLFTAALFLNLSFVTGTFFESPGVDSLLRLFVLAIPVTVAFRLGLGALRGMENTRYKIYAGDLLYPGLRLLALAGLIVAGVGVMSAGYAYLIAAVAAFLAAHVLFHRLVPLVGPVDLRIRPLVSFSAPLVVSTILAVLLTRTDLLMLGYFKSSGDAGLYSASYSLATSLLVVVSSMGYLYLPLTSRLDAEGEREAVNEVYQITTKWMFILSFPAFVVFVAFAGDLLSLVFGSEYRAGATALVILTLGFFSNVVVGRNRETLSALGFTKQILAANVVALALNFVLNLVLIPPYGIVGAAVASTVSYLGQNAVINAVLRFSLDITPVSQYTPRLYVLLPVFLLPPAAAVSHVTALSLVAVPVALVALGLATLAVVFLFGCVESTDLVAVELIEDMLGVEVPYVRRFVDGAERTG